MKVIDSHFYVIIVWIIILKPTSSTRIDKFDGWFDLSYIAVLLNLARFNRL